MINVEYNQLDPLLRTQGGGGDVADPATGYSPFPGNANNIVIEMGAYAKTLRGEDQGVVVEFVNPKYKDDTRTEFNKPTRLECMMQDIPKLFQKEMGKEANIGFTMFDRWFTFSPAKVCTVCISSELFDPSVASVIFWLTILFSWGGPLLEFTRIRHGSSCQRQFGARYNVISRI